MIRILHIKSGAFPSQRFLDRDITKIRKEPSVVTPPVVWSTPKPNYKYQGIIKGQDTI